VYKVAQVCGNLGNVYQQKREWGRAIEMYRRRLETFTYVGDVRGIAQTCSNLGSVYAQEGEWDRAIEVYQRSLQIAEKMGDYLTSANQYGNLGSVYLQTGQVEEAKHLFARAYLVFSQVSSPNASVAFQGLVRACGSIKAANAYLARFNRRPTIDRR